MKYEWRKISSHYRLCMLLLLVVMCNALSFYRHCTQNIDGYTMWQIQEKYKLADKLDIELEMLEEQFLNNAVTESERFVTGNYYSEVLLDRHMLERLMQSREYETYRAALVSDAKVKLNLGLMGRDDSFAVKTIQRGMTAYERLAGTVPEVSFSGGTELFTDFPLTDGLCLIFALLPSLWLLTVERSKGQLGLTCTTKHGRGHLYFRKFAAMLTMLMMGLVLLYGSNALMVVTLFDVENMAKPLQSVFGFRSCGYSLTLGRFLAIFLLLKCLWALCCGTIIFALCSGSRNVAVPACGIACLSGIAATLGGSTSTWLQTCSLIHLSHVQNFFQGLLYLNLLGTPVSQLVIAVILLVASTVAAYYIGLMAFLHTPKAGVKRKAIQRKTHLVVPHSLVWYEGYKLLITSGGLLMLVLLLIAAIAATRVAGGTQTLYEQRYRAYSAELSGTPSKEKELFLTAEAQRFAEIQEKLTVAYQRYGESVDTNPVVRKLTAELETQDAFVRAQRQYEYLREGQVYLYQTPYRALFGSCGRRFFCIQLALLCLALVLVFSRYFTMETESGVATLHTTAGRSHLVWRYKFFLAGLFLFPSTVAAIFPRLISVMALYGALDLTAQANSVEALATLNNTWSVGGYLLVYSVVVLLAGGVTVLVSALAARRTGNAVIALLLPLLVVLSVIYMTGMLTPT